MGTIQSRVWGVVVGGLLGVATVLAGCSGDDEVPSPDAAAGPDAGADAGGPAIDCDVAIVGGGAGGLYTAFRLAATMGQGVCLFEKDAELGGRIHDVQLDETDPQSPRFGTGARRVMEGQTVLFELATELGLTMEMPELTADLVSARGRFGFSKDALLPFYPAITPDTDPLIDEETFLYDKLRLGTARPMASTYPDFRAYVRDVAGDEEYWFLHDMSRFRADFEYPLDARGYLDYLDEEWDVCCTASYPVGGMSAFIRGMETKSTEAGARVFKGEPVLSIDKVGTTYRLVTANRTVNATKVVIAVPPDGLRHIEGDVSERIQAQQQFQDIIGVRVVTVTQWWPSNWWAQIHDPALGAAAQVWRAWTTGHCLNFIEIPLEPYAVDQNVTRSVYDDDIACVAFWEEVAKGGDEAVAAEVKRGLEYLFSGNGVSAPASVVIPEPLKTHVQIWPNAWHWLRAGSEYTNAQLFDWAVEPLAGEPVGLVGEAYNVQRSGWSDGAYKSSIHLLEQKYGMTLTSSTKRRALATPRTTRSQGGH